MWRKLWHSLGKAAGFTVASVAGTSGPAGRAGRLIRQTIGNRCVIGLLDLTAARLCRAAAVAFLPGRWALLVRSGMQVSLGALTQVLLVSHSRPSSSLKAVLEQAKRTALLLRERDVVPNKLGIDGIPGSGKSTLARALAVELGMTWKSLDYRNIGLPGNLAQERTIYEHHRLFRTQDVDIFEAIIYIDEPVADSRAKLTRRGRGLVLAALLDCRKLKKVGEIAFDVCDGESLAIPDSHLILKIRPPGGFQARENIARRLSAAGFDTSGMIKEEMLFLLACGRRQAGLKAYLLPLAGLARLGRLAAQLHSQGPRCLAAWRAWGSANRHGGASPSVCG